MRILLVDNYDSFTFNLFHLIQGKVSSIDVVRNDKLDFDKVHQYDKIVLSPGPGIPSEASKLKPLVEFFSMSKSILGICLGHQAIGEVFGCKMLKMSNVMHGSKSFLTTYDTDDYLFKGLKNPIQVGHYHSWILDDKTISSNIKVIAESENLIMAITHKQYDVKGLQFHPESILTPQGEKILDNWLTY
jgi:anthranilate synthase component 2